MFWFSNCEIDDEERLLITSKELEINSVVGLRLVASEIRWVTLASGTSGKANCSTSPAVSWAFSPVCALIVLMTIFSRRYLISIYGIMENQKCFELDDFTHQWIPNIFKFLQLLADCGRNFKYSEQWLLLLTHQIEKDFVRIHFNNFFSLGLRLRYAQLPLIWHDRRFFDAVSMVSSETETFKFIFGR